MDTYKMKANFRPVEPKNGHVGFADLTIADAIHIRDISVFQNKDGNGYHIQFPGYGEGEQSRDYIVPLSAEARAQFVDVITKAVNDEEKHFGWTTGKQNPYLEVSGKTVEEPYADARFSVKVADLCMLHGISTREVEYAKDGEDKKFVAVDLPNSTPYVKDGEKIYPPVFEALKDGKVYDNENKQEVTKDFAALMNNLILAERKKAMEKKTSLDEKIAQADEKAAAAPAKDAPAKEAEMAH